MIQEHKNRLQKILETKPFFDLVANNGVDIQELIDSIKSQSTLRKNVNILSFHIEKDIGKNLDVFIERFSTLKTLRENLVNFLSEALVDHQVQTTSSKIIRNIFKDGVNNKLVTSDDVKSLKSADLRNAAAASELPDFPIVINLLTSIESYTATTLQLINNKMIDLDMAHKTLSRQLTTVEMIRGYVPTSHGPNLKLPSNDKP